MANYFAYAKAFTLADNTFSSLTATSFPNHLYTISATSGGVISQATGPAAHEVGCQADLTSTAQAIDQYGNIVTQYPCYEFQTLGDLLKNAGITWTTYAPGNVIFNAYNAINHISGFRQLHRRRTGGKAAGGELAGQRQRQRTSALQPVLRRELDGDADQRD